MRIAVLIYGRLNKCTEHYNNIIESIGREHNIDFFASSDNSPESQLNEFIKLYKPISYINDPANYDPNLNIGEYPFPTPEFKGEFLHHKMKCHFINKGRVFLLLEEYVKKENMTYDVIISLRVDIVCNNKFNFQNIDDNTIYIPLGYDYVSNGINDQIAYGKIEVMKKYNTIFDNMLNLIEKKLTVPHPESITYANIYFHKLNIVRFNLSYYLDR